MVLVTHRDLREKNFGLAMHEIVKPIPYLIFDVAKAPRSTSDLHLKDGEIQSIWIGFYGKHGNAN